jgi:voltage-gated potassium channel Kch
MTKRSTHNLKLLGFTLSLLMSIILGVWGFHQYNDKIGILDLLYLSLQLFSLTSGAVDGPIPMELEIARWLAPLTIAGGAVGTAVSLLGSNLDRWKARRLHGHHIICGLGGKGAILAADLLAQGEDVVALDPSPDAECLKHFRKLGGLHLAVKASHPNDLNAAGIEGAATFTAFTPSDADNLAMALAMEMTEAKACRISSIKIFTHIGSVAYRDLLDRNSLLGATPHGPAMVRSFNVHANLARLLFETFPLETASHEDGATNTTRQIHLILGSIGPETTALIVHAARTGHYLGSRKVHIHVIAPDAIHEVNTLKAAYPNIDLCCASLLGSNTKNAHDFAYSVKDIIVTHPDDCFTVFPCIDESAANLETILRVHEAVPAPHTFHMPIPGAIYALISPVIMQKPLLVSRLTPFPSLVQSCGREAVFNEKLDQTAEAIYQNWYNETSKKIALAIARGDVAGAQELESKATYKPWSRYTEEQKDSNRSQADHFNLKIRAAGLDPTTVSKATWLDWCNTNADTLESLARVEHDRWCAHLWLAGWKVGPREDSLKIHNDLIPYEKLSDDTKNYDRDVCLKLADYLPE